MHRFLVLSLLAHLLACWVRVEREGGLTWWEAGRQAARILFPELVVQVVLQELHALGLWPPGGGATAWVYAGYAGGASFEAVYIMVMNTP
ncbi:hypothetical protein Theos_2242 (plasmid) [Thermus oshimai JL-2]|uniref:Uncharacterized protein n=1 Tax=Thermus oshimai JL-2 TaxID=751945 RepID=K7QYU5_THEOS|nr:hypothetical protein [Thermus oshimai]AFV77233.1 hypothetical protein Theos_2242 [Thermus oshimai JL-2]